MGTEIGMEWEWEMDVRSLRGLHLKEMIHAWLPEPCIFVRVNSEW